MNEFEKNQEFDISEEALEEAIEETVEETLDSELQDELEGFEEENLEETTENKIASPAKKRSGIETLYDYVETFCYALALMMVLFLFVFRYVMVDGDSMKTTLHNEDKLIISNLFYTPKTGDIVVINPDLPGEENKPIIKRVIATGGQKVYIDYKNWEVFVDGVKLNEPYIEDMRKAYQNAYGENVEMRPADNVKYRHEFTVGEGMVFVMGDNRNGSLDSRGKYGELAEHNILGRVIIRIAPEFGIVE